MPLVGWSIADPEEADKVQDITLTLKVLLFFIHYTSTYSECRNSISEKKYRYDPDRCTTCNKM